jgi:hypothetical protein
VRQQGLPVHRFVVEHEPGFVNEAWELVLQQPAVLMELDDEELCFVGEREPGELMGPLWTRLAVDLAQRFDGITMANRPLRFYQRMRFGLSRVRECMEPAT